MIKGKTVEEIRKKLSGLADKIIERKIDDSGFSLEELKNLNQDELQKKLDKINEMIVDSKNVDTSWKVEFDRDIDYYLPPDVASATVGYGFYPSSILMDRKKVILDLINTISRSKKINSLKELIENISDTKLRVKIDKELKDYNKQTHEIEKQERDLSKEEKDLENSKKQLEISKSKLEILEKKSQIWLTFLAKESVASIIGALLLIIIAVSLLISMFLKIQTTEIVESTFLLILGYFFGHAVAKK